MTSEMTPTAINELVPIEGFTVGRIVHYQSPNEFGGECRAAMIVRTWDARTGSANLSVFPDEPNDRTHSVGLIWKGSVNHARMGDDWGHWHFPQSCIGEI